MLMAKMFVTPEFLAERLFPGVKDVVISDAMLLNDNGLLVIRLEVSGPAVPKVDRVTASYTAKMLKGEPKITTTFKDVTLKGD